MTRPLAALLTLLAGCDALEQIAGVDPVKEVVRDNPVDPVSTRPLVFSLDSDVTVVGTVRPSIRFSLPDGVSSYSLQIAATPDFSAPLAYEETGITEPIHRITTPLANHGSYHWRVRPRYADGKDGGWSDAKELEVELPVPIVGDPTTGSTSVSPYPFFTFHSPGPDMTIDLQISSDSIYSSDVSGTESFLFERQSGFDYFRGKEFLLNGVTYFWRSRILDEADPEVGLASFFMFWGIYRGIRLG